MTTSRGNIPAETLFLLSPARCGGERAELLARSKSPLGVQLRAGSAPLGDVFAWLSALYFRGKLAYATRFAKAVYVMTPGEGLLPPNTMGKVDIEELAYCAVAGAKRRGVRPAKLPRVVAS